jgi:phosphate-selective porin OprO/OprP
MLRRNTLLARAVGFALLVWPAAPALLCAEEPIFRRSPDPAAPPGVAAPAVDVAPPTAPVAPAGAQLPLPPERLPNPTPPAAPAANADLERRVKELEEQIKGLQAPKPADAPATSAPAMPSGEGPGDAAPRQSGSPSPAPVTDTKAAAGWDDGFFLRSTNGNFLLRITGQVQADYRAYLDAADRTDIDQFILRRARFGLEATLFKYYEFRFLPDFGQAQTRIQDGYVNVHYWDEFQVETGKFKQPFSYEQLIQDRFTPLMERSLIDQLVPARDVGVMAHGQKLLGDRIDWGVSVFNGENNGDGDTNDLKDYALRVAVRPFKNLDSLKFLDLLQTGFAVTTGVEQEPTTNFILRTPAGVPFFHFNNGVRADGLRNRYSPELAYFLGGFGFAGQYFLQYQEFLSPNGRTVVDVPAEGYYFMTSYLLTGEQRTGYSQAIDPLRPFDPRIGSFGPGAWEVVGRVSRLRMGPNVFAGTATTRLADPTTVSNGATETTFGFNWYLNKWIRVQFNWEHALFDRPVQLGPSRANVYRHEDSLMTRMQIIF